MIAGFGILPAFVVAVALAAFMANVLSPVRAADTTDPQAGVVSLEQALRPHAWMAAQPAWPCRYAARFSQQRPLGQRTLQSSGRIWQDCTSGLIWQVEQPVAGAQIYARGGNFLSLDRRGRARRMDGLAERRIGALLVDLFGGDLASLAADFRHHLDSTGAVTLVPRDRRLAARLARIVIHGDAALTTIRVYAGADQVPEEAVAVPMLTLLLDGFELAAQKSGGCERALTADAATSAAGTSLGTTSCDAVRRPGHYLQVGNRAAGDSR